jgi:hypothetical protein
VTHVTTLMLRTKNLLRGISVKHVPIECMDIMLCYAIMHGPFVMHDPIAMHGFNVMFCCYA